MRLVELKIGSDKEGARQRFKNLKNVTVNFDENEWITVVIGWNGTGKSNVLEALATLFRDLVMDASQPSRPGRPEFAYQIIYRCHDKEVKINADPDADKEPYQLAWRYVKEGGDDLGSTPLDLFIDDDSGPVFTPIHYKKFRKESSKFLPSYIFGYYSGHSTRMRDVFLPYLKQYDRKLRNPESQDPGLRRLFYALPIHSQFVLLAFVLQQDLLVKEFLDKQLGLEVGEEADSIDSVLLVLNEPSWNRNKSKRPVGRLGTCQDNPDIFWGAEGVVRTFLDSVLGVATAPVKLTGKDDSTFWNKTSREYLYLFIKDLPTLEQMVGKQVPREFFRDLESTYVSELIKEVRIRVKLRKNDGAVTFRELSEGEQQLLTVLGLLRFTAAEESLFLLDEPDTHLNPHWSVDYISYLQAFSGENGSSQQSSHIVLTTHNPIAIADLRRQQLQILYRDPESMLVSSHLPTYEPRGMGYAGIITSDMFGLPSSLDKRTQRHLETYRILKSRKDRTSFQEGRLRVIEKWLEADRFKLNQRDDDYQRYLEARTAKISRLAHTDDDRKLIKFALNMSAAERQKVAEESVEAALKGLD